MNVGKNKKRNTGIKVEWKGHLNITHHFPRHGSEIFFLQTNNEKQDYVNMLCWIGTNRYLNNCTLILKIDCNLSRPGFEARFTLTENLIVWFDIAFGFGQYPLHLTKMNLFGHYRCLLISLKINSIHMNFN